MKNLQVEEKGVFAINGRELHSFLGSKKDFSSWMKYKIKHCGLEEGVDFSSNLMSINTTAGRPRTEYFLNQDSTIMICLSDNTKIGKLLKMEFLNKILKDKLESILDFVQNLDIDLEDSSNLFVYILKEKDSGRYKVGISRNPEQRVKQLNTGNPELLELIYCEKADLPKFGSETQLKKKLEYGKNHLKGEWFSDISILVRK